jgi:hypothetical protein
MFLWYFYDIYTKKLHTETNQRWFESAIPIRKKDIMKKINGESNHVVKGPIVVDINTTSWKNHYIRHTNEDNLIFISIHSNMDGV